MRLSNVLLRISWERPTDESDVAQFIARTTDQHVIPGFVGGIELAGNNQANTAVTLFVRPDKKAHLSPGASFVGLFDAVVASGVADIVSPDEIHAWVFVEGEVVMRGMAAVESYKVVRSDEHHVFSDMPDYVLILTWLRFLSVEEIEDLETQMGNP